MKNYIIYLLITCAFIGCTKNEVPDTDDNDTPTIVDTKCYVQTSYTYDATGDEVSHSDFYYSNERLDSIHGYSSGVLGVRVVYSYTDATHRTIKNYLPGYPDTEAHGEETLDSEGNLIESRQYDASGNYVSKTAWTYDCY